MAFYELIYIIRPDLTNEQVEQVNKRVVELVAANGGKILHTELWGRRELAYEVKKNTKGFYVFQVVEGGNKLVRDLESRLQIDEDVIKYLSVRVREPRLDASPMSGEGRREIPDEVSEYLADLQNDADD